MKKLTAKLSVRKDGTVVKAAALSSADSKALTLGYKQNKKWVNEFLDTVQEDWVSLAEDITNKVGVSVDNLQDQDYMMDLIRKDLIKFIK